MCCFNKKHREGYKQNICDYRQILAKINRRALDCIEESVPPMLS